MSAGPERARMVIELAPTGERRLEHSEIILCCSQCTLMAPYLTQITFSKGCWM